MTMSLHFLEWRTVQANDMVSPTKRGNRVVGRQQSIRTKGFFDILNMGVDIDHTVPAQEVITDLQDLLSSAALSQNEKRRLRRSLDIVKQGSTMFVSDVLGQLSTGNTRLNEHATQYILNSVEGSTCMALNKFIKPAQFVTSKEHLHSMSMVGWQRHLILSPSTCLDTLKPQWAPS